VYGIKEVGSIRLDVNCRIKVTKFLEKNKKLELGVVKEK
jgi:hypothetical protein